MQNIYLKKGKDRRLKAGHLWIFSNEIDRVENGKDLPGGSVADIFDSGGRYLGCGYYNSHSLISARLLSRRREPDQEELIERRILSAIELRSRYYGKDDDGFRLIYSEGDLLPGLIVDAFGDWLVVQLLTAGMEQNRETIIRVLKETLEPKGIVLRNDSSFREMEGLERTIEFIDTRPPSPLVLNLEGLNFSVDLESGQKTGHFFDQSCNRMHFRSIVEGYNVLDTFCYTGAWGLQAAKGGAKSVTFVDSSAPALELTERNIKNNGFENTECVKSDVVKFLKKQQAANKRYDAIVLDPPAFAKSKKSLREASKGYFRLNKEGMRCLPEGGLLVTSSCSYHMPYDEFISIVGRAAASIGRFARIIRFGHQAPDHPVPAGLPEAAYLKCLFVQVD